MKFDPYRDEYEFSSGRKMYAHWGIIGIDEDLRLSEGYDGGIGYPGNETRPSEFTPDDMRELADELIRRWTAFREALNG